MTLYNLKINTIPSTASITINGATYSINSGGIAVESGTLLTVIVSADNYVSKTVKYIMPSTDSKILIELVKSDGGAVVPDATTTIKGKVQLATDVEALAGIDSSKAIVSSTLKAVVDNSTSSLSDRLDDIEPTVSANVSAISTLSNDVSTNTSNISSINDDITTLTETKADKDLANTGYRSRYIISAPNGTVTATSTTTITFHQGCVVAFPDGLNADGTKKSLIFTVPSDVSQDISSSTSNVPVRQFYVYDTQTITVRYMNSIYYLEQSSEPSSPSTHHLWYNPNTNRSYRYDGSAWVEYKFIPISDAVVTSGVISRLKATQVLELVTKDDFDYLARIPSIDTTRLISNIFNSTVTTTVQTYELPDDGYIRLVNDTTIGVFVVAGTVSITICGTGTAGQVERFVSPLIKKGTSVTIQTGSGTATLTSSAFFYCNKRNQ